MRIVYHLIPRAVWEAAPASAYQADSLATEVFIHCSNAAQVAASANRFFANEADLLVLHLDAASFGPLLRDEVSGTGGGKNYLSFFDIGIGGDRRGVIQSPLFPDSQSSTDREV